MDGPKLPERRYWTPDVARDVDDEIAFHLEERQRELQARGVSESEARERALKKFGGVATVAAACRAIDEQMYRERRRSGMWTELKQDATYAVRSLARTPGFTAIALLTLALGIGANTAMFSVINAVLLRPLPYKNEDRLVFVWSSTRSFPRAPLTPGRLIDFREQLTSISGMAGISHISVNLTGTGDPERISASSVSSNFFDLLGVGAWLGEPFHAGRADDRDIVLSHGLWVRRFGQDPNIVGREITINGTARRIVAVMPPDFEWPSITGTGSSNGNAPELWVPAARQDIPRMPQDDPNQDLSANRRTAYLRALARLKDGVSVEQAQGEAEAVANHLGGLYPEGERGTGAVVQPLRQQFFGVVRQPLLVLFAAVVFVLAIACANAASLLLGRATARRRELAVRLALGASRGRVVRQLLTESLVLSLGGAVLGVAAAWIARGWLVTLAPEGIVRLGATRLDLPVLGFTLLVSMITGVLFGLIPAAQSSRVPVTSSLADDGARGTASRGTTLTRNVLVAAQIGVSVVLLVGAGLLIRSFATLSRVDTGIDTHNLLTFDLFLSGPRATNRVAQSAFYDDVLRELRALPGVVHAGAAVTLPIGGDDFGATITIEGKPLPPAGQEPAVGYQIVTPGYFEAIGMRIRSGRDFNQSDTRDSAPVVLVNETLARQHWPGEDPVGRRLRIGRNPSTPLATVVGVVSDIRHLGPTQPVRPEIYEVHTQSPFSFMAFVVRTAADPEAMIPSVRAAVARLDPAQPVATARSMDAHLERALARPRFMSTLTTAFGALALVLAVIGLYGVISYSVTQRAREIAIRTALGARSTDVMRMVLTRAVLLAATGVAAGTLAALFATRFMAGLLYGVTGTDPVTFTATGGLLFLVALCAAAVPALRAARIGGASALR
jgi:putative ABC transport system permease protein